MESEKKPRLLVPYDGSEAADRALAFALRRAAGDAGAEVLVLNVQPPIPRAVSDFVGGKVVKDFQAEEAGKVLEGAAGAVAAADVPVTTDWKAGPVADTIAAFCHARECSEIVMGSRGMGGVPSLLLGSVATRVLHLADVPVTIVK